MSKNRKSVHFLKFFNSFCPGTFAPDLVPGQDFFLSRDIPRDVLSRGNPTSNHKTSLIAFSTLQVVIQKFVTSNLFFARNNFSVANCRKT